LSSFIDYGESFDNHKPKGKRKKVKYGTTLPILQNSIASHIDQKHSFTLYDLKKNGVEVELEQITFFKTRQVSSLLAPHGIYKVGITRLLYILYSCDLSLAGELLPRLRLSHYAAVAGGSALFQDHPVFVTKQ
jgi:hypothetical protein